MIRNIYKLEFSSAVHFGKNKLSNSLEIIHSDTLFSALAIEWINIYGKIDDFINAAENENFRISSAMPYKDDIFYIKKPIMNIEIDENYLDFKRIKKIKYVPIKEVNRYTDFIKNASEMDFEVPKFTQEYTMQKVNLMTEKSEPYNIEVRKFNDNCGLYFIAQFENEEFIQKFEEVLYSLSLTGIGGKVSSGLGKFTFNKIEDKEINSLLDKKSVYNISLSLLSPSLLEIQNLSSQNLAYNLITRGGFVNSSTYRNEMGAVKRKRISMFEEGSCFNSKIKGNIVDVSDENANHPVYRYGIGMYIGVDI